MLQKFKIHLFNFKKMPNKFKIFEQLFVDKVSANKMNIITAMKKYLCYALKSKMWQLIKIHKGKLIKLKK